MCATLPMLQRKACSTSVTPQHSPPLQKEPWPELSALFGNRSAPAALQFETLWALPVAGSFDSYPAVADHRLWINGSAANTASAELMLDGRSSALAAASLDMNMYWPAGGLFTTARLLVERSLVGAPQLSLHLDSIQLLHYGRPHSINYDSAVLVFIQVATVVLNNILKNVTNLRLLICVHRRYCWWWWWLRAASFWSQSFVAAVERPCPGR